MGTYLNTPKTKDGENGRVIYGLSLMQGWCATMEDDHAAHRDLDSSASFFGVYDGHGGKVVAKFCAKFLHQQVLKQEAYPTQDIETFVQKLFLRMDEMMRGQRREEEKEVKRWTSGPSRRYMVQQAMQYIDQTPDIETKIQLIKTLNNVSTGKEDDGKDCDSSDDEDDDKRYSLDPSWPQSYRKSVDLYSGVASPSLMRIAILKEDRCKPKKCRQECKKSCHVVKTGKLCIEVSFASNVTTISEELCIGCGICVKEKAVEAWRGHGPSAHELKEGQCVLHQLKMKVCGESDDNKVLLSTQERRRRSTSSSNVSVE
ncbi:probable protein phosphatase 2C 60 [Tanacetum coccineum]